MLTILNQARNEIKGRVFHEKNAVLKSRQHRPEVFQIIHLRRDFVLRLQLKNKRVKWTLNIVIKRWNNGQTLTWYSLIMWGWSSIFITCTSRKIFFKLSWSSWLLSMILTATWLGKTYLASEKLKRLRKQEVYLYFIGKFYCCSCFHFAVSRRVESVRRVFVGAELK